MPDIFESDIEDFDGETWEMIEDYDPTAPITFGDESDFDPPDELDDEDY